MKALTKEVKIALVAIAGVVILFFGMNFLKGLNLFSSTNDYYIEFDDISGLSTSSPIYADGYKVGTVKSVIYDYSNKHPIRVVVGLDNQLADPALAQSLHNVQTITSNLTTSTVELNTLMRTLNKNVPTMMAKANTVLDNTTTLTNNLATLDLASTKQQIDQTLSNVNDVTAKLNSKDGTVGLLLNDPGLYNRLNATVTHADSLMIDLKQHPKRYVHFSVFGRKDKNNK